MYFILSKMTCFGQDSRTEPKHLTAGLNLEIHVLYFSPTNNIYRTLLFTYCNLTGIRTQLPNSSFSLFILYTRYGAILYAIYIENGPVSMQTFSLTYVLSLHKCLLKFRSVCGFYIMVDIVMLFFS